jgi:DNA-binding response OmpR family regulator
MVYVVDDDASAREGVARLIRSAGLFTRTFASGEEFLAAPRPKTPSCLVLDVNLPGLSGLDVQQELAKSGPQLPIVFLTGHGDIPMTVRAVRAGAADFLTKPVDDEALLDTIQRLLRDEAERQKGMATMGVVNIDSVPKFHAGGNVQPGGPRLVTGHHGSVSASTKDFPPFRLDMVNQCLWRLGDAGEDERLVLKPKAFAILRYLVEHAGRLVTQDELLDAVWPDTHVNPEVLKRHIFDIRGLLGDDPRNPTYIETLARRGYQFIAAIRNAASAEPNPVEIPRRTRIVGRDRALRDLQACLQKTLHGQRQIVFVTGEPGIGKTALVDEFLRHTAAGTPIRIARGQCVEGYGGKEAYYPVLEALGDLCRAPEGRPVVEILAAQAPAWLVQFPALMNRQQRETLPLEIQGAARQRMLREIVDALETITAEKPLILVLEDLNWVDGSTVDLISALARGRSTAKLMVIGTYRPEDVALSGHPLKAVKPDLVLHRLCQELALEPLREEDIAAYLAAETPDASVPKGLAGLLHRRSEGNPLCMVAALDHMTRRGFLSRADGGWRLNVPFEEIDPEALDVELPRANWAEQSKGPNLLELIVAALRRSNWVAAGPSGGPAGLAASDWTDAYSTKPFGGDEVA